MFREAVYKREEFGFVKKQEDKISNIRSEAFNVNLSANPQGVRILKRRNGRKSIHLSTISADIYINFDAPAFDGAGGIGVTLNPSRPKVFDVGVPDGELYAYGTGQVNIVETF